MSNQTKKGSAIETILNVGSGYFISMIINLTFLPFFIVKIAEQDVITAAFIGVVYTITSMVRSYLFRRVFNKLGNKS